MDVFVLSKSVFDKKMSEYNITNENVSERENDFFISIINSDKGGGDSVFTEHPNVKVMYFDDVERPIPNTKTFNRKDAQELLDFIEQNKDKKTCVVHCSAGISRSGAVGRFINDYFGESYYKFKNQNPLVMPNGLVSKLLNEEWRKREIA